MAVIRQGTVLHGYPSDDVPALPHVAVSVPGDWTVQLVPTALFAVMAPEAPSTFRPNVLVTTTRVSGDFDLDTAEGQLRHTLAQLPDSQTIGSGPRRSAGLDGRAHDVAFTTGDGQTLVQLHWLAVVRQSACADLVHLTATCTAGQGEQELPRLRDILASVSVVVEGRSPAS